MAAPLAASIDSEEFAVCCGGAWRLDVRRYPAAHSWAVSSVGAQVDCAQVVVRACVTQGVHAYVFVFSILLDRYKFTLL